MASPLDVLGSLAWVGFTAIPFLLFAFVIALVVFVWIWLKTSGTRDQMKEMYLEMMAEAKNAPPPNLKKLYRLDLPRMDDLRRAEGEGGLTKLQFKELMDKFKTTTPGIFYGEVVGFNTFDLWATVEDLFLKEKINGEEKEKAETLLNHIGKKLHLVVYQKPGGWFRKIEQGLFCFDDQLLGLDSSDGVVSFLGTGTQKHAVYFQTPSGYPERSPVFQTHLISNSRVRTAMLLESNIVEFVLNAVNFDTTALKTIELYASRENMGGQRPKEEGK